MLTILLVLFYSFLTAVALAALIILLVITYSILWKPYSYSKIFARQGIPVLPRRFPLGQYKELRNKYGLRDMETEWNYFRKFGKVFLSFYGPFSILYVSDPEMIKKILVKYARSFDKPIQLIKAMEAVLPNGTPSLISLNNKDFAERRKIISPTFHFDAFKNVWPIVGKHAALLLDQLDISKEMNMKKETARISCVLLNTALTGSESEEDHEIAKDVQSFFPYITKFLLLGFFPWPKLIFRFFHGDEALQNLHQYQSKFDQLVEKKLAKVQEEMKNGTPLKHPNSILSLLMNAGYHGTEQLTANEVKSEAFSSIFGLEAVALVMMWSIYVIAKYPEWQEKARKEVLTMCGTNIPTFEDMKKLETFGMLFNETMRMFPPVTTIPRKCLQQTDIDGFIIPAGTTVRIPIYHLHHNSDFWVEDPNVFNPLRFKDGVGPAVKHPFAFMPFGGGPRSCVGKRIVQLQTVLFLAMFLQRYQVKLSPSFQFEPESNPLYELKSLKVIVEKC